MPRMFRLQIANLLPPDVHEQLSRAERDAVLEVAYLAIAADGKLVEEEIEAFVEAMLLLYGPQASAEQVRRTVARLVAQFERGGDQALLQELSAELTRPWARDQAYKLAYAMAMSDLDTDDHEFEFDQRLRRALGLSDEVAEALADEVIDAIRPPGG